MVTAEPPVPSGRLVRDPRLRERKAAVARQAGRRRLRGLAVLAVGVVLVVAALLLLHSALLSARAVTVRGALHESRAEILAVSGLAKRPPLIDIDQAGVASAIEALPWVRTATVSRHWPDGVSVNLVERQPLGEVPLAGGKDAVVDRSGRVLEEVAGPPSGLVVLTGVGSVPRPGGFLQASDGPLLQLAAQLPATIAPRISSISKTITDGLVLRVTHGPLVVLGSSSQLGAKMVSLTTLLDKASLNGIVTIDLRVPAAPVLTP
ncbi:MAG: Polypeptide-transport-associated domain protein FtsQ-type [Acidimicrobiaceae bacterium]|nr:Polypeptide-transport-associated domain protein FtsQ-type [Acidimicrobiaceae bacterium]